MSRSKKKNKRGKSRSVEGLSSARARVKIPLLMQKAVLLQKSGQVDKAELLYQRVLKLDPQYADAFHLSGLIMWKRGDLQAAVNLIQQAIKINSDVALYYNSLGSICRDCAQWSTAMQCYQKSLQLEPANSEIQDHLGLVLAKFEKFEQAEPCFREVIRLNPEYADAHFHLALVLGKLERLEEAEQSLLAVVRLRPEWSEAWYNLADTQKQLKQYSIAEKSYREVIRIQPENINAQVNMGDVLKQQEKFTQALECYERALELDPECSGALNNMGMVFFAKNKLNKAIQCYEKAHYYNPDCAEVYLNWGNALIVSGSMDAAEDCFKKALILDPDYIYAHWSYSFALLLTGDFTRGWQEHEWRLKVKNAVSERHCGIPLWQGEDLSERTLLVYAEQGIGDEIRYANCVSDVARQAGRVVIECDPRLQSLYQRSFPEASVYGAKRDELDWLSKAPPIDLQIAVGSLPMYTRTCYKDFPRQGHYLTADPNRVAYWKERLQSLGPGPRVGIAWRGNLSTAEIDLYYADFKKYWGDILCVPGVQFINMMYAECGEELEWAKTESGVEIHHFSELDQFNDMEGVAALLKALDLLITVPISVSELAGALAVPTWYMIFNHHVNTLGSDHLPWFPDTRCFFKDRAAEWGLVTEKLAQELLVFSREF